MFHIRGLGSSGTVKALNRVTITGADNYPRKVNINIPTIPATATTPLGFIAFVFAVSLVAAASGKVRSHKGLLWAFVIFAGIALGGGIGLAVYMAKPIPEPVPVAVTNTGPGGAAVGTNTGIINVGGGNGK